MSQGFSDYKFDKNCRINNNMLCKRQFPDINLSPQVLIDCVTVSEKSLKTIRENQVPAVVNGKIEREAGPDGVNGGSRANL